MLDLVGKYAQIIEAIAVVASLIYVAIQVSISAKAARSATYQSIIAAMADIEARISADENLARIYKQGCDGEITLSETELVRFNEIISSLMNFFENLYYQRQKRLLEEDMWEGWSKYLIYYLGKPGITKWWGKYDVYFSESFRNYLTSNTEKKPTA